MATKPVNAFVLAADAGPYDERSIVPPEIDPQLLLSRNTIPQPFYLIHEKDALLVQMSGQGRLLFADGGIRFFDLHPGDFAYIPGGMAHRFLPIEDSVQLRYRAREAGLECVAWRCESCDAEITRKAWDTSSTPSHDAYLAACEWFNGSESHRACGSCGAVHPSVDTSQTRWSELNADPQIEEKSAP